MKFIGENWSTILTVVGVIATLVTLCYNARQIKINRKISQGQFWIELEKLFSTR